MKVLLLLLLSASHAIAADMSSVHGMLLFGKDKIYISHLPMFHSPHDYQALAELDIPPAALNAYHQSLASHPGDTEYTLVPETFSLPEMMAHPKPFHADLFHGHFERGGDLIAEQLTVKIKKVLYFRKFTPGEAKPALATYLLFGTKAESFLAHFISAKPDFDQIVAIGANDMAVEGKVITISANNSGNTQPLAAPSTVEFNAGTITLLKELYVEFGDLAH